MDAGITLNSMTTVEVPLFCEIGGVKCQIGTVLLDIRPTAVPTKVNF